MLGDRSRVLRTASRMDAETEGNFERAKADLEGYLYKSKEEGIETESVEAAEEKGMKRCFNTSGRTMKQGCRVERRFME